MKHLWVQVVLMVVGLALLSTGLAMYMTDSSGDDDGTKFHGEAAIPPPVIPDKFNNDPAPGGDSGEHQDTSGLTRKSFNEVTSLSRPIGASHHFGLFAGSHENGHHAFCDDTSVFFYLTDTKGEFEYRGRHTLENGNYVNGVTFAKPLNTVNEIYYCFLSIRSSHPGTGTEMNPPQANRILLFQFNTADPDSNWAIARMSVRGQLVDELKHPFYEYRKSDPRTGTFGDKVVATVDDSTNVSRQAIYVRGTQFDVSSPGGSIFWYVITKNTLDPAIEFVLRISDEKLLLMYREFQIEEPDVTRDFTDDQSSNYFGKDTYGFGIDFYVTSGFGKSNVMVVLSSFPNQGLGGMYAGNDTSDPILNKGTNATGKYYGYVQLYVIDPQTGLWTQRRRVSDGHKRYFVDRLALDFDASSVFFQSGALIVGMRNQYSYQVYHWSGTGGALTLSFSDPVFIKKNPLTFDISKGNDHLRWRIAGVRPIYRNLMFYTNGGPSAGKLMVPGVGESSDKIGSFKLFQDFDLDSGAYVYAVTSWYNVTRSVVYLSIVDGSNGKITAWAALT